MPEDQLFDLAGCLVRVRQRDQAAARELVEHLYPLVIRIVRAHLPRRVAEEDLSQEVFLKMFTRLEQYQGTVPFTHWVSRIAVTTCIDQLRAQRRRPELRWADLSEGEASMVEACMVAESPGTQESSMAAREIVGKLMAQLKPTDQVVIRMLDLEQKTLAEISAITGWNQTLIKVRAFRARRKLQRLFQDLKKRERS